MDYSKKEIIKLLEARSKSLRNWFIDKPLECMDSGPEGAWTSGQHLLHLIKSTKPLAVGFGYPRILLRLKFGKPNSPTCSYEELVQRYQDVLKAGAKASGEYVPREVKKGEREALVERFRDDMGVLINNLHKWSEKKLDTTAVAHPVLGKVTLREILYFTIYHTEHHLQILEERH